MIFEDARFTLLANSRGLTAGPIKKVNMDSAVKPREFGNFRILRCEWYIPLVFQGANTGWLGLDVNNVTLSET